MHKLLVFFLLYNLLTAEVKLLEPRDKREEVLELAESLVDAPYRYGGKTPGGFDCSGFTNYVFRNAADIELARSSSRQVRQGGKVKLKKCKPGDLIFFSHRSRSIDHVGIVYKRSNGKLWMIHASSSKGVIIEEVLSSPYWSKRLVKLRSLF